MWIKWITPLITRFFPVFSCFFMWITFFHFLKVWAFFFDIFFRLCKLLIFIFSSTFFIHTLYVENVDKNFGIVCRLFFTKNKLIHSVRNSTLLIGQGNKLAHRFHFFCCIVHCYRQPCFQKHRQVISGISTSHGFFNRNT